MDKRIEINLNSNTDEIMSVWEIQDMLKNLGNNYYKLNIIVELSKMIAENKEPNNIIIFNESFDIKTSYSYLKEISNIDIEDIEEAKKFYHLGNFVSMYPNRKALEINLVLKFFRDVNSYLYKKKSLGVDIKLLDKNNINEYLKLSPNDAFNIIKGRAINRISKLNIEKEIKNTYIKEINLIENHCKKELENYNKNEFEIESIKSKIGKNEILETNDKNINKFTTFYERLNTLERPIVGIFKNDYKEVDILCSSFICKETRDKYFLDLKNFSHNSPTAVDIGIGITFALIAIPLLIQIKQSLAESIDSEESNEISKNITKTADNVDELILELENECETNDLIIDRFLDNDYIKSNLVKTKDGIIGKVIDNLNYYDFSNDKLKCKVIDFNSKLKGR